MPNDDPKDPRLPVVGQKNGENDECWFRAPLAEQLLNGNPYPVQFYIQNDFNRKIHLSLFEGIAAPAHFEQVSNENALTLIGYDRAADIQDVYMLLERSQITDYEFLTGYRYSISYLNHLEIYSIEDQSGLGADEIHLTMTADDMATNFLDFIDKDFDDEGPFTITIPALKKGENSRKSSLIIEAEGAEYQISNKLSRNPNR